jgi:MerR family transcriptional regulator, redox-sensitive transcriptional activator SoxR
MLKSSDHPANDRRALRPQRRRPLGAPLLRDPGTHCRAPHSGNQRRYERAILRRIALIQAGRAAGIPLERIRAALDTLPSHRTPTRRDWERLSRGWRDDLDRQIATLHALRNRLTTCIGCGCLSIDRCSLLNPDDEAGKIGPGAHYLRRDSRRASTT